MLRSLRKLTCAWVLTAAGLLAGSHPSFDAPKAFAVAPDPEGLATGDFNGDGNPDVVVAGSGGLTVLLGRGDGTFVESANYAGAYDAVAVGDFNGDGKLDLAIVANSGIPVINIALGKGDGTFEPPVSYTVGDAPAFVAVGASTGMASWTWQSPIKVLHRVKAASPSCWAMGTAHFRMPGITPWDTGRMRLPWATSTTMVTWTWRWLIRRSRASLFCWEKATARLTSQ